MARPWVDTGVSVGKNFNYNVFLRLYRAFRRHFDSKFHATSRHLSNMFNKLRGKEKSGTIIKMLKQMNTSKEQKLLQNKEIVKVLILS